MNKKILIIGFGKRAQEVVLPALEFYGFEVFIYSRNINKIKDYKTNFKFKIIEELNYKNLIDIEKIFICTRNEKYNEIINQINLLNLSKKVDLFFDTPLSYHYFNIIKFKENFKNIIVCEDEGFDPIIFGVKNLINENYDWSLIRINLNSYGYIFHSISQILKILDINEHSEIEKNIQYGLYCNLKKIKYLLKIKNVKIFFNNERDFSSNKSNLEIYFKHKKSKKIKKCKIEYYFEKNKFMGFKSDNVVVKNRFVDEIKNKFHNLNENFSSEASIQSQIKIMSFYLMIEHYEKEIKSNIFHYIKGEYFASLTTNLRFFFNLNFNFIKFQKLLYKIKKRI